MSLYDEALAAGQRADLPKDLDPELLRQILALRQVGTPENAVPGTQYYSKSGPEGTPLNDYTISGYAGQRFVNSGESMDAVYDPTGNAEMIFGPASGDSWSNQRTPVYDLNGKFQGYNSGDGDNLAALKFAAASAGGYYGAGALNGMEAASAAASYGGASAAEQAAINAAIAEQGGLQALGTTAATSFPVAPAAVDATTALTAAETSALTGTAAAETGATTSAVDSLLAGGGYGAEMGTLVGESALTSGGTATFGTTLADAGLMTTAAGGLSVEALANGANAASNVVTPNNGNSNVPVKPVTNNPFGTGDLANLFNVLSGLYGMKLAGDAAEKSDPFGPYRKGYADKLQALESNPGLMKNVPGFLAGQDAIKRQMAAKGYLGSGNMTGALMRYGGDSYQNEANRLATLAGANIGPGQTYFNQANLVGQSLSNIGYGLAPYMQGGPK